MGIMYKMLGINKNYLQSFLQHQRKRTHYLLVCVDGVGLKMETNTTRKLTDVITQ
jgi:hypothetical protein